jgi:hypothetical protein
MFLSA